MKRFLLSLIAFAGVWMTAGAQTNTDGYVLHTVDGECTMNRADLNHVQKKKSGYNYDYLEFSDDYGTYTLYGNARVEYLSGNDKCLDLHKGTQFHFKWADKSNSLYHISSLASFKIKTAEYRWGSVYCSINGGSKVDIGTRNLDKSSDNAYTMVSASKKENEQSLPNDFSIIYENHGTQSQYICYISFNYQIEYYTLDFTKADDLVTQATKLYNALSAESKASTEGQALNTAKSNATTFKETNENTVVAIGDQLRTDLTDLENALQKAIDAFSCELDENVVYDKANKTVTNITVKRTMKGGNWSTLCLPFDMAIPTNWKVKTLSSVEYKNGTYNLQFADASSIVAGTPYIVKTNAGVTEIPYNNKNGFALSSEKGGQTEVTSSNGKNVTFFGSYSTTDVPQSTADDSYFIIKDNQFHYVDSNNVKIKGFRGYFEIAGVSFANALRITFDDEDITGISFVNENEYENENLYNIAGQRVNANAKGIIIKNGKKYFVK